MEPGERYLIVTTFGWGFVGRLVRLEGLAEAVLEDCHFVTNCGENTDWGRFCRNGPGKGCVVNLVGIATVNLDHRIWSVEYGHDLPKSR